MCNVYRLYYEIIGWHGTLLTAVYLCIPIYNVMRSMLQIMHNNKSIVYI